MSSLLSALEGNDGRVIYTPQSLDNNSHTYTDQDNNNTGRAGNNSSGNNNNDPRGGRGAGNMVGMKEEDKNPIFAFRVTGKQPKGLAQLAVSSDVIILAMDNCHVIRSKPDSGTDFDDIEVLAKPRIQDRIHKIFVDPMGNSVIISLESKENFFTAFIIPQMSSVIKIKRS